MNKPRRSLLLPLPLVILLSAVPAMAGEAPTRPAPAASARAAAASAADSADGAEKGESRSSRKPALRGTVNLNTADAATLELLPGIGEKKAARIIDFRHKHPFKKVEELTRVKGFGKKTLGKLKPYLTITGASTLGADDAGN